MVARCYGIDCAGATGPTETTGDGDAGDGIADADGTGEGVAVGGVRGLQASGEYGPGGGDGGVDVKPKSNGNDDVPSVMYSPLTSSLSPGWSVNALIVYRFGRTTHGISVGFGSPANQSVVVAVPPAGIS
jgi:hypothetical protein